MASPGRREFLISKAWIQAVVLVVLCGFFVLGLLAYRTYRPTRLSRSGWSTPAGTTLFTGSDIAEGQQVFLNNGLMEYGSAFGHGAYLGPDYTADYLRRVVGHRPRSRTAARLGRGRAEDDRGHAHEPLRLEDRHAALQRAPQAARLPRARPVLQRVLLRPQDRPRSAARTRSRDPKQLRQLTAFFAWTAWAAAANRPGHDYSYTNNWPSEPRVDNTPTANVIVWSVLSLIALLGGIGAAVRRLRPLGRAARAGTGASRRRCRSARPATSR